MTVQPAGMDTTPLPPGVRHAGFWRRFAATAFDVVLILFVTLPLSFAVYGKELLEPATSIVRGPADFVINWVLPIGAVLLFWRYRQATPGKMVMDLVIVDEETLGRPDFGQLVGRYFAYVLSMLPLMLGYLWCAWDPRKQCWHDKLAGTLVLVDKEDQLRRGAAGVVPAAVADGSAGRPVEPPPVP